MSIRPYLVEVFGTPEAGKTTAIKAVIDEISKNGGVRIQYLRESAEIIPKQFKRASVEEHLWMKFHTAQSIMIGKVSDADIVIADRGIMDTLLWDTIFMERNELTEKQVKLTRAFFEELNLLPKLVIVLMTNPKEAIKRRGGEGRIVTEKFLESYNSKLKDYCKTIKQPVEIIDTTNLTPKQVSEFMKNAIEKHYYG